MLNRIKSNLYGSVLAAAFITIAAMIIGVTIWSIRAANENVDQAVNSLSSFYMEELLGKREVVLRDSLNHDFDQLDRMISLLEAENIQTQDALREFLAKAQVMCGANTIAIVDDENTVYTAHSTYSDASRYAYLQNNFTNPQIVTSNLYGAKKQVIVAVPIKDFRLLDRNIIACFMQIDIGSIVGSLTYEDTSDTGNTFIGLYYKNGDNLTNSFFDDITPGQNLLVYLKENLLSDGQSFEEIEQSFRNGEKGLATVKSDGETEFIYYLPVEDTDWMLTVMVHDNTIADQLEYTSNTMMRRNNILMVAISVFIIAIFWIISFLNKRNSDMLRKQNELEVKARNEEKLRTAYNAVESSRKELAQQLDVIGGMSNAFFAVYAVNLKARTFLPVKESAVLSKLSKLPETDQSLESAVNSFLSAEVHPDDRQIMTDFTDLHTIVQRLADTDSIVMEYHSAHPSMEWCRASWIVASRNENGSAERVLYTAEDISAIVQERKTNERNLKLAREEAEKANKAKTDFLFNMSHDIRTPMNAIIGFSKIMENELNDPAQVKGHLVKLQESSFYLLSIINNILDMARIESGKTELNIELMDLLDKDGNVADMFTADLRKKNLQFSYSTDITHRYVYADNQKLRQIAANLISNAVKYTPSGGSISVRVDELPCEKPDHASFCLTVSDTGIGMSREFQEHIFESFTRERTTTQNNVIGTGLGMAIVKKLIDMQGGTISVESELGKGSTFRVITTHRIAESQEDYIQKQTSAVTDDAGFSGKRILLAEDNDINAEIAITILEETGASIERAEDGVICVDMLEKAEPGYYDVILMDIQMPNMDGYKASETIRLLPDKAKACIPIIAMTANAFEEDRQNALKAGMNGHLAKPIDIPSLMETLGNILT